MKKNIVVQKLAVICVAISLLTAAVGGSLVMANNALAYTTVKVARYATYRDGMQYVVHDLEAGDELPTGVVQSAWGAEPKVSLVASNSPSTVPAMKSTSGEYRAMFQAHPGAKGIMFKFKAPNNGVDSVTGMYLIKNNEAQVYQASGNNLYVLPDGATAWETRTFSGYGALMPSGFEGYVYYPFSSYTTVGTITEGDVITGYMPYFTSNYGAEYIVSAPMLVMDNLVNGLPSIDKIILDGVNTSLSAVNVVPPTELPVSSDDTSSDVTSSDGSSSGDTSSDGSSSDDTSSTPREPRPKPVIPAPTTTPEYTIVVPPNYMNYDKDKIGLEVEVTPGEAFPSSTLIAGTANAVLSPMPFSNAPIMEVSPSVHTRIRIEGAAGGVGAMVYVKTPDNGHTTRLQYYLNLDAGSDQYQYGYKDWYILAKGASSWSPELIDNYGPLLPSGFEGYVYIPYNAITLTGASEVRVITDENVITGSSVWFVNGGSEPIRISAPIIVSPHGLSSRGTPTANKVIVNGVAYDLFAGLSGDDSDLPLIDYGNLDIAEVKQPNLGGGLPMDGGFSDKSYYDGSATAQYSTKVDSLTKVGPYPTIKNNKVTSEADSHYLASFYPDTTQSAAGAGVMLYVKMPNNGKDHSMKWLFNFRDSNDVMKIGYIYDGAAYIMAKGETEWTTINVNSWMFTLPAGFEGYIRQDYKNFTVDNEPAGVVPTYKLSTMNIYVENDGSDVYLNQPLIIQKVGNSKNAAYLNGNKRAAINLFTGEVATAAELRIIYKIGDTLKQLPIPTTTLWVHDWDPKDVTRTTAKISWDAFEGAASYRVDVYEKLTGADGLEFVYTAVQTTNQANIKLVNLKANTRYAIVVTALNAAGGEIAVYDYLNLQTPIEDPEPSEETSSNDKDTTPVDTGASSLFVPIAIILFMGAVWVVTRCRKEMFN